MNAPADSPETVEVSSGPSVEVPAADQEAEDTGLAALLTTNASQLALGTDPRIDEETHRLAAAYSHVAKGFWIDERCGFSGPVGAESRETFTRNVELTTVIMRRIFERTTGIAEAEADRLTQQVQMRSLQEMSSNQFYGCGTDAQTVFDYATQEAAFWASQLD